MVSVVFNTHIFVVNLNLPLTRMSDAVSFFCPLSGWQLRAGFRILNQPFRLCLNSLGRKMPVKKNEKPKFNILIRAGVQVAEQLMMTAWMSLP